MDLLLTNGGCLTGQESRRKDAIKRISSSLVYQTEPGERRDFEEDRGSSIR